MRTAILLLLTLGVLDPSPSLAFEGRYRAGSQGYRQDLTIKRRDADSYNVELGVGTEGCSGYLDGIGRVEGATLVVRSPPPADPDDKCVVAISRKGVKLDVTEDNCNYWHGASCEFSGIYKKR
jgi:hypothetical protein